MKINKFYLEFKKNNYKSFLGSLSTTVDLSVNISPDISFNGFDSSAVLTAG